MKKGPPFGDPFPPRLRSASLSGTITPGLTSAVFLAVLHPLLHLLLRRVELRALLSSEEIADLSLLLLVNRLEASLHVGAQTLECRARSGGVALLAECAGSFALALELFMDRLDPGTILVVNRPNLRTLRFGEIQVTGKSTVESPTTTSAATHAVAAAPTAAPLSVDTSFARRFYARALRARSLRARNSGNSNKQCSSKSRSIKSRHQTSVIVNERADARSHTGRRGGTSDVKAGCWLRYALSHRFGTEHLIFIHGATNATQGRKALLHKPP